MAPSDEREHVLVAVLFTESSGRPSWRRRWATRLGNACSTKHHSIVRRLVKSGGGRIVDTAGDGVFAIFARPAAAIRRGFDAIRAVREIGIEIRAGVHFGESESAGGKVSGIAVHTASRVMSLAEPGEVLGEGPRRRQADHRDRPRRTRAQRDPVPGSVFRPVTWRWSRRPSGNNGRRSRWAARSLT